MRHSRGVALAVGLIGGVWSNLAEAMPITYDFLFSGSVQTTSVTDDAGVAVSASNLVGRAFTAEFLFTTTGGDVPALASLNLDLSGAPGSPYGLPNPVSTSNFYISTSNVYQGSYEGLMDENLGVMNFTFNPVDHVADLSAEIFRLGVGRADSTGEIDLQFLVNNATVNVSAVPLPPALSLFGAALLALGAVGFGIKRRAKTADTVLRLGMTTADVH